MAPWCALRGLEKQIWLGAKGAVRSFLEVDLNLDYGEYEGEMDMLEGHHAGRAGAASEAGAAACSNLLHVQWRHLGACRPAVGSKVRPQPQADVAGSFRHRGGRWARDRPHAGVVRAERGGRRGRGWAGGRRGGRPRSARGRWSGAPRHCAGAARGWVSRRRCATPVAAGPAG